MFPYIQLAFQKSQKEHLIPSSICLQKASRSCNVKSRFVAGKKFKYQLQKGQVTQCRPALSTSIEKYGDPESSIATSSMIDPKSMFKKHCKITLHIAKASSLVRLSLICKPSFNQGGLMAEVSTKRCSSIANLSLVKIRKEYGLLMRINK